MERTGGLSSYSSRSWFPHAMQSHIWEKPLGGAFYHLLAMAGGEPGAMQTGKVTDREASRGSPSPSIPGISWKRLDF